jgi:hypothetical protein
MLFPLIDEGVNTQAAPAGSAEQAKVIVPVNPVEYETERVLDPVDPGALIVTCD